VYQYAWDHGIAIESCNFLDKPEVMRPSVMPMVDRLSIIDRMNDWITIRDNHDQTIVNTRDPSVAKQQIIQDLQSYVEYLKHEPDESFRLPELMTYLKRIEFGRKNSVLTYLPQYEKLFRTAGY
jgi:hypothetical protein